MGLSTEKEAEIETRDYFIKKPAIWVTWTNCIKISELLTIIGAPSWKKIESNEETFSSLKKKSKKSILFTSTSANYRTEKHTLY